MRSSPPLEEYRRKRDPARTPEPMGGRATREGARFVIQKHRARRLHYDLRLETDGVLKSWAVPKGPSVDPKIKRLAVQVEDHPLDYASFEGVIPAGNYGAGEVIVWDRGTYRLHGTGPPTAQLAAGRLELELEGGKLRGRWMLVRTGRRADTGKNWLLIKKADAYAGGPEPTETRPESVLSGRAIAELGGRLEPERESDLARRLAALKLPPARLNPEQLPFMLPTLFAELPTGGGWAFEIKWDGVRVLALRRRGRVSLHSRNLADVTRRYPEITAAVARLPGGDLALDGEIVALDSEGRPSFHRLQGRMHRTRDIEAAARTVPVTAYMHDCLALHGYDLRGLPLAVRKDLLRSIVPSGGPVRYSDHLEGDGRAFFEEACAAGLEGVVAKRLDAPYRGGRRQEWRKIKCYLRQEFAIGGYTDPKGTRAHLGALHIGVYEGDALVYVGRVGSGFDTKRLGELHRQLRALATDRCPFTAGNPPRGREHHWVRPELVCEVRFTEWTPDGSIRHPVFLGLRTDRPAREVHREKPISSRPSNGEVTAPPGRGRRAVRPRVSGAGRLSERARPRVSGSGRASERARPRISGAGRRRKPPAARGTALPRRQAPP